MVLRRGSQRCLRPSPPAPSSGTPGPDPALVGGTRLAWRLDTAKCWLVPFCAVWSHSVPTWPYASPSWGPPRSDVNSSYLAP
jgi:hypothetical protein